MVVPYSNQPTVPRPRGSTIPLTRADETPTASTPPVATDGAGSVRNARSAPRTVPRSFDATRRKWYATPALSFSRRTETTTGLVPAPAERVSVREPYRVLVPYSIHQPVVRPLGSTVPPTVAADGASRDAEPVATAGSPWVVNVASAPRVEPEPFEATTR